MNDRSDQPAHPSSQPSRHVAIIGGGISGLAAAFRLQELAPGVEVTLLESRDRLGGTLNTVETDGYLIEESADNYLTDPPTVLNLAERLGMRDEMINTEPSQRRAFVVFRGKLQPVPAGFTLMAPGKLWPILTTPLLSWRGKLRLAMERLVPQRGKDEPEESLAQFATRRLGREVFERIVQPLVAGIYSADSEKLSVAATLPRFIKMEQEHGSLTRAAFAKAKARKSSGSESGARYGMFVTPRNGASSFVSALAAKLPQESIRLNTPVQAIERSGQSWQLTLSGPGGTPTTESFDAIVMAAPAPAAARLLEPVEPGTSRRLAKIPHASAAILCLGYRREQFSRPLEGFGFVVPTAENRPIMAASFSSNKFPGRAPDDQVLIRVFFGGALDANRVEASDEELKQIAQQQLGELIGVSGEPVTMKCVRWREAMPQYHIGHQQLVAEIEQRLADIDGLELANNALHGVGVPQCIAEGERAAESIAQQLAPAAATKS